MVESVLHRKELTLIVSPGKRPTRIFEVLFSDGVNLLYESSRSEKHGAELSDAVICHPYPTFRANTLMLSGVECWLFMAHGWFQLRVSLLANDADLLKILPPC